MSSSHEAASQAPNAGEYILHHLGNLNTSGKPQAEIIDFSIFNIDTFVFALLTGGLGIYLMWRVARNASAGVPGRAQAALEILVEMQGEYLLVNGIGDITKDLCGSVEEGIQTFGAKLFNERLSSMQNKD